MPCAEITIVAGGWSVKDIDLTKLRGRVIAVNDAALNLPRVDIVVTMDRLWTEHRWLWLMKRTGPTWVRFSATQNIRTWPSWLTDFTWLTEFVCDHESTMPLERDDYHLPALNGTHSGMCALNLAYQMRPARVFLLGFDLCRKKGRAYFHSFYSWASWRGATSDKKYAVWATQFGDYAAAFKREGIEVCNVSPGSAIQDFKKITAKQYAEMV